jgi:chloramphenicol-sensitive protein RarD
MSSSRQGILFGLAAYFLWGLFPLYFKLLEHSGTVEIVLHRYIWALPICAAVIAATGAFAQVRAVLRSPRRVAALGVAAATLALTSGVYVYAVNSGHVIEASLGYFINPLATVALGVLVIREPLRPAQWAAVATGALAVIVLTVDYGRLPWIALSLACSFGIYGLVKKRVGGDVGALVGLTIETLVLAPVAVAGVVIYTVTGHGTFAANPPWQALLLASGGVAVVAPLLPFAAAARRVPLTTVGLLQYVTPVLQLLCGLMFGERMPPSRWIGFGLVWVALVLLTADGLRARSQASRVPEIRAAERGMAERSV